MRRDPRGHAEGAEAEAPGPAGRDASGDERRDDREAGRADRAVAGADPGPRRGVRPGRIVQSVRQGRGRPGVLARVLQRRRLHRRPGRPRHRPRRRPVPEPARRHAARQGARVVRRGAGRRIRGARDGHLPRDAAGLARTRPVARPRGARTPSMPCATASSSADWSRCSWSRRLEAAALRSAAPGGRRAVVRVAHGTDGAGSARASGKAAMPGGSASTPGSRRA